jgi:catechol 2,3-dioxygenase-like lactoylglutathione lyase family enzyme
MPSVSGVLETSLYVDDLLRAVRFYEELFGFPRLFADERMCALAIAGKQVLLLFLKGASLDPIATPGGAIPPHDGEGRLHLAFSIAAAELPEWEARLAAHGIPIESRVTWSRGGTSLYFHDPDGHVVELATPGLWAIY